MGAKLVGANKRTSSDWVGSVRCFRRYPVNNTVRVDGDRSCAGAEIRVRMGDAIRVGKAEDGGQV